eukprot:2250566-Prymnesium_polylepis.2
MSGRTATWRQTVHSTFMFTVNERVGRLPSDQASRLQGRLRTRELFTSAVATQHRRVRERRSFPGKVTVRLNGLVGPAL